MYKILSKSVLNCINFLNCLLCFLLVFSVVAAVALWLVIAVEYGPEATRDVTVNVRADFESIKKNFDLTCYGNYDKQINVTIKGQRVVVDSDEIADQIEAELSK